MSNETISPLRRRMIEDMTVRGFGAKTRNDYVRHVRTFSAFIGGAPATATAEDVRRFQLHQSETGEDCGQTQIAYNSCRNRHCPKCQGAAASRPQPSNPHRPPTSRPAPAGSFPGGFSDAGPRRRHLSTGRHPKPFT